MLFNKKSITLRFCVFVISFTNQLFIVHQIKVITRLKLNMTHSAHKTLEMINIIMSSTDGICGWNTMTASTAFRSKFPLENT